METPRITMEEYDAALKAFEDAGIRHADAHVAVRVMSERLEAMEKDPTLGTSLDREPVKSAEPIDPIDDLPTNVKIGGKVWDLYWTQKDWDYLCSIDPKAHNQLGATKSAEMGLWIYPGQHIHQKRDTLLHEVLHMIFRDMVQLDEVQHSDNLEEIVAASQTPWLLAVLRENPKLFKWLSLP